MTTQSLQFVAQVKLVAAVVRILDEHCPDSKSIPGWKEFVQAEHLLLQATWLGRGNLVTIQCLILKTLYLIFSEKHHAASDAIATAVRLCYQIGLHDQTTWRTDSAFDVTMRQRIFWCLYCLDRHAALVCGVPYLIRESDFRVDQPPCVDDKDLSPGEPAPEENPDSTSIPYLRATIKWGKLCSEIWDAMFSVNAPKPASADFIAGMDARVELLKHDLPLRLKMNPGNDKEQIPLYVHRQKVILNLVSSREIYWNCTDSLAQRANHLRLLLRRPKMVDLQYDDRTAEGCVSIATDTINTIHAIHTSTLSQRTDRYSSVIFLAGAIIPLICIIVKDNNRDGVRATAVDSFHKALALLQDISPGLEFARLTLQRLRRIVDAANKAILNQWPTDLDRISDNDRWIEEAFGPLAMNTFTSPGTGNYQIGNQDLMDNSHVDPGNGANYDSMGRTYGMEMFDLIY